MFQPKQIAQNIVEWIKEYFDNNASPNTPCVIGISGGKDSSVVAALCVQALGRDRVIGVLMPSGTQSDIDVAYDLCKTLGIKHFEVNIGDTVSAIKNAVRDAGLNFNDVATVNTPARIRMTTLYAVSAIFGGRVANTCNLSEDWVGYSTKFGDAAGDFSPLSRFTVDEVKQIGKAIGLDDKFVDKVPIDGLSGKTDEDNLGFTYAVLDRYIRQGEIADQNVKQNIDRRNKNNLHKLQLMPCFEYKP